MYEDRGVIKWTSLMLPEHVTRLKEWQQQTQQVTAPEKTEWELEDLQQTVEQAFTNKCPIQLAIFKHDASFTYEGIITHISLTKQLLYLQADVIHAIALPTIYAAQVVEFFD